MIMTCGILFHMSLSEYLAFSAYYTMFETSAETPLFAINLGCVKFIIVLSLFREGVFLLDDFFHPQLVFLFKFIHISWFASPKLSVEMWR